MIRRGEIYVAVDKFINSPKSRLPGSQLRNEHDTRLVLIVQSDDDNGDPAYPEVLVAPLSHRTDLQEIGDYKLHRGQADLNMDSLAQLGILQPILKQDLLDKKGALNALTMAEIDVVLAELLGLVNRRSSE